MKMDTEKKTPKTSNKYQVSPAKGPRKGQPKKTENFCTIAVDPSY
jgi:hypothetical protein